MRDGSFASLNKLGFPSPDVALSNKAGIPALIMKSGFSEKDDDYKERALEKLRIGVPVFAAFDNEPAHINHYRRAFPHAICVHLLTDHSMRDIQLLENIVSIQNFVRVIAE